MSKLSYFLLGVIIVGLAFITGVRMYRSYEEKVQEDQAAQEAIGRNFTVQQSGVPSIQLPVFGGKDPSGLLKEIYLQDAVLPEELDREQARQTLHSILDDYSQDPKLQAFYQDLQQSTGQSIELTDLSGENLPALLTKYPQIQQIIAKHSQDPEFVKTLQEIFSNPQFIRSVVVLQQNPEK